jgi:hypothetical protein
MFLSNPDDLQIHNWTLKSIGEEIYIMQTHKTQSKLLKTFKNVNVLNVNNVCICG